MIKLPKKVADTIERIKFNLSENMKPCHYLTDWSWLYKEYENDAEILHEYFMEYPVEYMIAIVEGYEVELTPEEKFVERYNEYYKKRNKLIVDDSSDVSEIESLSAHLSGMRETLNIFGIEIEGINV